MTLLTFPCPELSNPKLEERKRFGFGVMAFLVLLAGVLFAAYRKVWKDAH